MSPQFFSELAGQQRAAEHDATLVDELHYNLAMYPLGSKVAVIKRTMTPALVLF